MPPPILDPENPELPGGCRTGQLTEAGYDMALDLGSWLRLRYVQQLALLPRSWAPGVAALRSTPIRRTVATLRGVLTGLWPAGAPEPLQVAASYPHREIMYGSTAQCPRLQPLYNAFMRHIADADVRDPELPRLTDQVAAVLELGPLGQPGAPDALQWTKLYDTMAAVVADNVSAIPQELDTRLRKVINVQAERHEAGWLAPGHDLCPMGGDWSGRCRDVLRLSIGQLAKRLLDNLEAVAAARRPARRVGSTRRSTLGSAAAAARRMLPGEGHGWESPGARDVLSVAGDDGSPGDGAVASPGDHQPLLHLFSGHDSSISPLLAVLGQSARVWPPFASNVVFELWQGRPRDAADDPASTSLLEPSSSGAGAGAAGGDTDAYAGAILAADGRTLLARRSSDGGEEGSMRAGGGVAAGAGAGDEFWVRVLYNRQPLEVPLVSEPGGWISLAALRERVLAPYLLEPQQLQAACTARRGDDPYDAGSRRPWWSSMLVGLWPSSK